MKLSDIDLRSTKNVSRYLTSCGLPITPLTTYLLRVEFFRFYQPRLKELSRAQIEQQGYDPKTLLSQLFPFRKPDVPLLEYKIGQPISKQEAIRAFVETTIDIQKVPPQQRDMIDPKTNMVTDIITLQEAPLSQYVQLKESGELLSHASWPSFLSTHTTKWMGKESVGFKSPLTGVLMGNLVSFNFDQAQFFPQRPGMLTIQRIPNTSRISISRKTPVVPSFFFQLSYLGHRSYVPDTKEGRILLGLMKDAFKKGNLYALSKSGRVRQGRVHKKTSLTGTYGYPDDHYLDRVSGELSAIGSTPFIYQFSEDAEYEPSKDPYPQEKRFTLRYKE